MAPEWIPVAALVAFLLLLLVSQRRLTALLQELSIRLAGDSDVALALYFALVLPGIVLHELCHLIVALLLGVKVRRFALGPQRQGRGGRVSLGSIQVGRVDPVRSSLIGLAPLVGASAVVLLIGNRVLGMRELVAAMSGAGLEGFLSELGQVMRVADFWLWLYLIFAISNAMLPSESDMLAVRPVLIFLGLVGAAVLLVTGVPAMPAGLVAFVSRGARYLASAWGLTLAVDLLFMALFALLLALTRRIQDR